MHVLFFCLSSINDAKICRVVRSFVFIKGFSEMAANSTVAHLNSCWVEEGLGDFEPIEAVVVSVAVRELVSHCRDGGAGFLVKS